MAVLVTLVSQGGYFFPVMVVLAYTLTFSVLTILLLQFSHMFIKKHVKSVPLDKTCRGRYLSFLTSTSDLDLGCYHYLPKSTTTS